MLLRRRRGPGLVRMAATTAVVAGTAGAVSHHQQQKYANQAQAQEAQAQAAEPQAAPAPAEDPTTAELQRLASLHTSGVLTDEEFTAAKAKVLGI
jgi:multidrug resistance efflux pump